MMQRLPLAFKELRDELMEKKCGLREGAAKDVGAAAIAETNVDVAERVIIVNSRSMLHSTDCTFSGTY